MDKRNEELLVIWVALLLPISLVKLSMIDVLYAKYKGSLGSGHLCNIQFNILRVVSISVFDTHMFQPVYM